MSLPDVAPELPAVLLAGFRSSYADRLAAQLRASRKLAVIDAAVPWHGVGAALELHRPEAAVVCDETLDIVELALLAREYPDTGIVVLTRRLSDARARALDACRAAAMLQRDIDRGLLVLLTAAVARGVRGGMYITPMSASSADVDPRLASLSSCEAVVLELLREHRPLADLAAAREVGLATITSQAKSIYRKFGVSGRDELRRLLAVLDVDDAELQRPGIERATRDRVAFARHSPARWPAGWVLRPLALMR